MIFAAEFVVLGGLLWRQWRKEPRRDDFVIHLSVCPPSVSVHLSVSLSCFAFAGATCLLGNTGFEKFKSFLRNFSHIVTLKQKTPNLWNWSGKTLLRLLKPLCPCSAGKSLTTTPWLLLNWWLTDKGFSLICIWSSDFAFYSTYCTNTHIGETKISKLGAHVGDKILSKSVAL